MHTNVHIKLSPEIHKATTELGFNTWTEIQEKSIPIIQTGVDIVGQSFTGSGKTAAFGLPIIERTIPRAGIQAIILVPTRELCDQVTKEMLKFSKYKHMNIVPVFGGVSIMPQISRLKTAEIVVGTPGRVLDHIARHTIVLSKVKVAVLDEADRMLDMGFIDDVNRILSNCPKERQTLLFSATIPTEIKQIVRKFMKNPEHVKVQTYVDESKLEQQYYAIEYSDKFSFLAHLLKTFMKDKPHMIIFCSTRNMVDVLIRKMQAIGIHAGSIHGGLSQNARIESIRRFHSHEVSVMVASDVAARGLDIKDVTHVINYDIPRTSKEYIHRIGRTARAGSSGLVVSIVSHPDFDNWRRVLADRSLNIVKVDTPEFPKLSVPSGRPPFQQSRDGDRGGGFRQGSSQGRGPSRGGYHSGPRRHSDGRRDESREGRSESGFRSGGARRRGYSDRSVPTR